MRAEDADVDPLRGGGKLRAVDDEIEFPLFSRAFVETDRQGSVAGDSKGDGRVDLISGQSVSTQEKTIDLAANQRRDSRTASLFWPQIKTRSRRFCRRLFMFRST